jgi:hypothetical protein
MGMLCADTLKTPAGGTGRPIHEEDKKLLREVAVNAAAAMDAAAELRSAALALVEVEQAALGEALAAAEGAEEEGAEGEGADGAGADGEESPLEPVEGEDEDVFAARCARKPWPQHPDLRPCTLSPSTPEPAPLHPHPCTATPSTHHPLP